MIYLIWLCRRQTFGRPPSLSLPILIHCKRVLVYWLDGWLFVGHLPVSSTWYSIPWEPIGFEGNDSWLRFCSMDCCIVLLYNEKNRLCCRKCTAIPSSSEFRKFVGRATNTPYFYLMQRQLHSLLVEVTPK